MDLVVKAKKEDPKLRIRILLEEFQVSKSSFYRKKTTEDKDLKDYKLIKKIFKKKNQKIGIRQIKMILERDYKLVMNLKKIARIKRKYGLETQIRKKNKYRKFAKAKQEHDSVPNFLDRGFESQKVNEVYSTDITTLKYGKKKAYVAAVKDLCTKEIVGFKVAERIDLNVALQAVDMSLEKLNKKQKKSLMIHSDQGFHYTHFKYRERLLEEGILQSMSRKGNCIDNAPIESFFGILKDHLELENCKDFADVKKEVTRKIRYYNNDRPQLGLKKMPPSEYRRQLNS